MHPNGEKVKYNALRTHLNHSQLNRIAFTWFLLQSMFIFQSVFPSDVSSRIEIVHAIARCLTNNVIAFTRSKEIAFNTFD